MKEVLDRRASANFGEENGWVDAGGESTDLSESELSFSRSQPRRKINFGKKSTFTMMHSGM